MTAHLLDVSWRSDARPELQPPRLVGEFGDAPADYDQILAWVLAEARDWPWRPELDPIELVSRVGDALGRLGAALPEGMLPGGFTGPILMAMALPGIGVHDWTEMSFSRIPAGVDRDVLSLPGYIAERALWAARAAELSDNQCWLLLYTLAARGGTHWRYDVIGSLVQASRLVPPLDRTRWLDAQVAAAFGKSALPIPPGDVRAFVGDTPTSLIRTEHAMAAVDAAVARTTKQLLAVIPIAPGTRFTDLLGWRSATRRLRDWLTGVDREPRLAVALGAALAPYGYEVRRSGEIDHAVVGYPAHTTPTAYALVVNIIGARELVSDSFLDGLWVQRRLRDRIAQALMGRMRRDWAQMVASTRDWAGDVVEATNDQVTAIFHSQEAALERAKALLSLGRNAEIRELTGGRPLKLRLAIGVKGEVFRTATSGEGLAVISAQRLCWMAGLDSADRGADAVLMPSQLANDAARRELVVGPERTIALGLAELPELAVRAARLRER